jgi:hypothetical protein
MNDKLSTAADQSDPLDQLLERAIPQHNRAWALKTASTRKSLQRLNRSPAVRGLNGNGSGLPQLPWPPFYSCWASCGSTHSPCPQTLTHIVQHRRFRLQTGPNCLLSFMPPPTSRQLRRK